MSLISEISGHNLTSTSSVSSVDVIDDFEKKRYHKTIIDDFDQGVLSKIESFSHWLNGTGRIQLLKCDPNQSEISLYLLLCLKKSIKSAICEINKTLDRESKHYTCPKCNEEIEVGPHEDYWETLQNHEHFEENYIQAITGKLDISRPESASSDEAMSECSNSSSEEPPLLMQPEEKPTQSPKPNNPLNDFKFNFEVKYANTIETILYPDNIIQAARRYDKIKDFSMQRTGPSRGVCLLCRCNIIPTGRNGKPTGKMSPFLIKNHVTGQKHIKNANCEEHRNALARYHEFWLSQEPIVQAHQLYFLPGTVGEVAFTKCCICQQVIPYNYEHVLEHIMSPFHANIILELFYLPSGGERDSYYLLDMQVQVYETDEVIKNRNRKRIFKDSRPNNTNMINNNHHQDNSRGEQSQRAQNRPVEKKPVVPCEFVESLSSEESKNGVRLPVRYREHAIFFVKLAADSIWCSLCQLTFPNNSNAAVNHLFIASHRQLCKIAPKNFSYYCDICNVTMRNELEWDKHFNKGPNKHDNLAPVRKALVKEYECKTCRWVIYGDELSLKRHTIHVLGRAKKTVEIKLPTDAKKLFESKEAIARSADNYLKQANEVLESRDRMENCCKCIEEILSQGFPGCKAYWFGSRVSGLGNYESDLDIFLDIGNMYKGEFKQDPSDQVDIVKKATKELKSSKDFSQVFPIPAARTPIVKLHHGRTDLDCDISFRHGLGVENTKFLRFCMEIQPVTQSFILLLKHWSNRCGLNEHLTNYALALMAVFYLQINGYLPSVKTIRSFNPEQAEIIDGWETVTYTVSAKQMREFVQDFDLDLHTLLRNFFDYFSKFNYANDVICPLLGHTIPKMWFSLEPGLAEKLPPEMNSYKQRLVLKDAELFRALSPCCIQDPFDLSHNLTKGCHEGVLKKFKTLCVQTLEHLDSLE